jgi:hypothetical protein
MNDLIPVSDMQTMATAIVKSGFYGFKTQEQAMALMFIAQAEGRHPATIAQEYDVIQGRPALKSQAALARFQRAGGFVRWTVNTDQQATGVFSHPAGGELEVTWTLDQARRIGLGGKDSWQKYPKAMLRARCVAEGVRAVFPGCMLGSYLVEEVQDFEPVRGRKPQAEILELESDEVTPEGTLPLYVPNMEGGDPTIYKMAQDADEWFGSYLNLMDSVNNSKKLSEEEKEKKRFALKAVNMEMHTKLTTKGDEDGV